MLGDDNISVSEICKIIRSIAKNTKDRKYLQKVASDIMAIEKLCDVIVSGKTIHSFDLDDIEMDNGLDEPSVK